MESPKVKNWLNRLSEKSAYVYGYAFRMYMTWLKENGGEFAEFTGDELLEYQKNASNGSRYDVLDTVQNWILDMGDIRYKTKRGRYAMVRSFFAHNRAELPQDKSFKIKGDKPQVMKELTVENLRDVILGSNETYRAIFLSMFQGAMGLSEFQYWNLNGWNKLKRDLRNDPDIIKIELVGRKSRRNIQSYYTYIGRDAIDAIRVYLKSRPETDEAIFMTKKGTPVRDVSVSWMWLEKCKKLGIIKPKDDGFKTRYGKNTHQLRSLFRSQWQKSSAEAMPAEFIMGHTVDPLGYNQAFTDENYMRNQYALAEPMLSIMSSEKAYGYVTGDVELKVHQQERTISKQNETITTLETQILDLTNMVESLKVEFQEMEDDAQVQEAERSSPESQTPMTPEELLQRMEEATAKLRKEIEAKKEVN